MLPMLNEAEFWAAYDGKRPHNETAGKVPMPGRPRQTSTSRFPLLDASGVQTKSRRGIVSSAYGGAASFGTV
ncbi:hypothetical protein Neosp_014827 [[Neocosmospora] mangrovei]